MILEVKRFNRVENAGKVKGFADVTLEDTVTIRGVRLIEGPNGLFAGMPRRKEKDGQYHDLVSVELASFRQALTNALIREYQKENRDVPEEWTGDIYE